MQCTNGYIFFSQTSDDDIPVDSSPPSSGEAAAGGGVQLRGPRPHGGGRGGIMRLAPLLYLWYLLQGTLLHPPLWQEAKGLNKDMF